MLSWGRSMISINDGGVNWGAWSEEGWKKWDERATLFEHLI